MKKLVLSFAIASALGLGGCDSESIKDVQKDVAEDNSAVVATTRVIFDPTAGKLSVPNDLLYQGTTDGTLNLPVSDPTDSSDPYFALSAGDGWSTINPFVLDFTFPAGVNLDGNSVFNPTSVRIFEVEMGGPLAVEDCKSVALGQACKVVGELVFAEDFVPRALGNSLGIIPLKPLNPKTTYIVTLTDHLQDDLGRSIAGSTTYDLVRQDINDAPLGSEAQRGLQAVINSYENAVVEAGVDRDTIIYTMAMTTTSTMDAVGAVKSLMAAGVQQGYIPAIPVTDTGANVAQIFASQGIALPPELQAVYSTANYMTGSITLPYYLGVPSAENPFGPVNDWWKALCDSAVTLAGVAAQNPAAIPADPQSVNDGTCMAISAANGLPWPGLRDLGFDKERNITKYNPVPAAKTMMPIDVQVTTPDVAVANGVRASLGMDPIAEPASGWPVAILQHGITSKKEDMLAITGMLSLNGVATIAIDHPLHGSRGFDLDFDGTDDINASTVSATHYMNLASLLTTRDNLRQSTVDIMGLRLGINNLSGNDVFGSPINIDPTNVHFLGHSLGAITGINFAAMTNAPLNPAIDGLFNIVSNVQAMPGVGVANFLMESPAFGDTIKANLTYQASPDFKEFVDLTYPNGASEAELVGAYQIFYSQLTPQQQGALEGTFAQFTFAAQTVTDAGDPVNYATTLAATQTPTLLLEVVGNGSDNLPDQVIPNTVSSSPLAGTEPGIALLGLPGISDTTMTTLGAVRFVNGTHSSILSPSSSAASPDPELSARTTQEMQSEVAAFFVTGGQVIQITDDVVVKQ